MLVTGANGFLGSHVTQALRERGEDVRALVRRDAPFLGAMHVEQAIGDLDDDASLRRACRGARSLVHCAAVRGNGTKRVLEQRRVNVEGTARLYRAAHDHGLERIVHVSSMSTLGAEREPRTRSETDACNVRHLDLSYVETKLEAEERARSAAWAGMPVVIVNPAWLVGPRLDGCTGTVAREARARKRWVQSGGISMADVDDVSRGILAALDRGRAGERYLLGGHNLTWREVHERLARALAVEAPSITMPVWTSRMLESAARVARATRLTRTKWPPEDFRVHGWYLWADSSKAQSELGYAIRPLDEMIRRMLGLAVREAGPNRAA